MYVFLNNLLVGLVSLSIGSFLSAVSYRIIRNESFIGGRSYCDNCKKHLPWFLNIPLLSFLFLWGKCFFCQKKISFRYPLIELSCLIGSLLIFNFLNIFYIPIFWTLLLITITDIEDMIIPDEGVSVLSIFGILLSANLFPSLFSGFFAASILLFLNLTTKGKGLGLGDVKLAIPLGMILGLSNLYQFFTFAFVIGGGFSVFLLLLSKAKLKTRVPFGPFMIIAFWITVFFPRMFI